MLASPDNDNLKKLGIEVPFSNDHMKLQRSPQQQQALRKQRRCWSPELHRRFVEALEQLGGAQGQSLEPELCLSWIITSWTTVNCD